jgi:uncharacterized glyoxalase superfamily protein PhnB
MAQSTKRVPDGFHRLTPHLVVANAAAAIEFYKKAFGAVELRRMPGPDGKSVMHADLQIGDSHLFLNDEFPQMGALGPKALKGTPVTLHLYVQDADAQWKQAVAAGAEVVMPLADQFWGDRYGILRDPFGHMWSIGSHMEDLTPEEMMKRAGAAFSH